MEPALRAQEVGEDGEMTGPMDALSSHGLWTVGGTTALLAAFFLLRGRIRIEKGWGGLDIPRFSAFERLVHWLLALSFIALALTGLAMRSGPGVLAVVLGNQAAAEALRSGRTLHEAVAFAFMAGLVLAFLVWVRHSLPHWRDVIWLLKGGGMLVRGSHPPAWKFNAAQKLLFWTVVLAGALLSLSGLAMLFPHHAGLFAWLAGALGLPGGVTPQQELQYAALWHGIAALVLTCAVIIHIFLRTIGIQGAFAAMGSGRVDANWARQHHRLWAEAELRKMDAEAVPDTSGARAAPAE